MITSIPYIRCLPVLSWFLLSCTLANANDFPSQANNVPLPTDKSLKKILFFFKNSDYVDPVIRQVNGRPSVVQNVMWDLGKQNHIQFTFTADGSLFTPETIAKYDAFCFFTSGDLTERGVDQNPPMTQDGKAALLQAIRDGKGFIGLHSAAATFQSGAETVDPYVQMLGGEMRARVRGLEPAHQIVADKNFPGMESVPPDFAPVEEWYSLRNYAPDLHVLLIMDTDKMVRGSYYAPNYPSTWIRSYNKGRVFYTNLGHEKSTWDSPVFQRLLAGGLNWVDGSMAADVTPNIDQVTPHIRDQQKGPRPAN